MDLCLFSTYLTMQHRRWHKIRQVSFWPINTKGGPIENEHACLTQCIPMAKKMHGNLGTKLCASAQEPLRFSKNPITSATEKKRACWHSNTADFTTSETAFVLMHAKGHHLLSSLLAGTNTLHSYTQLELNTADFGIKLKKKTRQKKGIMY